MKSLFCVTLLIFCHLVYGQNTDKLNTLWKTVNLYPDSLTLHEQYLKESHDAAYRKADSLQKRNAQLIVQPIINQYESLIKKNPNSYIVPFAIGEFLCNHELPQAKNYLQQSISLNPGFARTYFNLWHDAERWGDFNAASAYIKKATELEPGNPDYAFYHASGLRSVDSVEWTRQSYEVAKRFPSSERGAQALYWVGVRSNSFDARQKAFETLRVQFAPDKFRWSREGMNSYFYYLLQSGNPQLAASLAEEMLAQFPGQNNWEASLTQAKKVIYIKDKIKNNDLDSVSVLIENLGASNDVRNMLLNETFVSSQNPDAAYKDLISEYAFKPRKSAQSPLLLYGAKLGKDRQAIINDIKTAHRENIDSAGSFTMLQYLKKDSLSLDNLKGKVVLITFWFPGCGPCRAEFPHFENVLKKFDRQEVEYLAINIVPEQDDYVVPFVQKSGYTFTPLHYSMNWPDKDLKIVSAPVSFLIDKNGNIAYKRFDIRSSNEEDILELMITSLLNDHQTL